MLIMQQNEQLAEELHKPVIKKIKRRSVYFSFKDNIWGFCLSGYANLIREFVFYYVLLIFLVNIHGLFL